MKYYKSPADWTPANPNPFSADGRYGPEWICFRIDGINRTNCCCGGGKNGPFTFILGADTPDLKCHLADFLIYNKRHKRNVIILCPESINLDTFIAQALEETPDENRVRSTDPRWVVHSTPLAAWHNIRQDGMLKSLALLRENGKQTIGLGIEKLGDPPDFANYVMLGSMEAVSPEIVVASRAKNQIVDDADRPYVPGVRIYFDNHLIIRNGLTVRDGLHNTKVRKRLHLSPYMAAAITAKDFPEQTWCPRTFSKAANNLFLENIAIEK
ncbi:MAG: hypothetical protein PHP98_07795 [Kiritimatiellae bacterium]|nr:hypothetical protein [Kiritimatiellia bacterium]